MHEEAHAACDLTVVIPSYDAAPWLPDTLDGCFRAVLASGWSAEVVIVDDGSTDDTPAVVSEIASGAPVPVRLVRQANAGRFLARWAGLQAATGPLVLLLDSRVLLHEQSLRHVRTELERRPDRPVFNGHAVTDPSAPLIGHFWEVPTHLFWGAYLSDPRPMEFGLQDFNRFPKGTGLFVAPRHLLMDACRAVWPTDHAALTSDDTKLIRHIAATTPVRIDPGFRALYQPRTDVRAFVRHSFGRGTFLVDSFGGTSLGWNALLLTLAAGPVVLLAAVVLLVVTGLPLLAAGVVGAAVVVLALPAAAAAARGCPARGVASYLAYLPAFVLPYWTGLLRGLRIHRAVMRRARPRVVA